MGWYSTGPRLREADLQITDLMTEYVDNPILVICEVQVGVLISEPHLGASCLQRQLPMLHAVH